MPAPSLKFIRKERLNVLTVTKSDVENDKVGSRTRHSNKYNLRLVKKDDKVNHLINIAMLDKTTRTSEYPTMFSSNKSCVERTSEAYMRRRREIITRSRRPATNAGITLSAQPGFNVAVTTEDPERAVECARNAEMWRDLAKQSAAIAAAITEEARMCQEQVERDYSDQKKSDEELTVKTRAVIDEQSFKRKLKCNIRKKGNYATDYAGSSTLSFDHSAFHLHPPKSRPPMATPARWGKARRRKKTLRIGGGGFIASSEELYSRPPSTTVAFEKHFSKKKTYRQQGRTQRERLKNANHISGFKTTPQAINLHAVKNVEDRLAL
ncbi:hypothetical protein Pcac1_g20826 [Phytophthora cactorum]|uniref:Uncharacterized protein n=1 Tax=Phytophthora cactorum TaxID=29920 RepID=A0A8T0ZUS0_9STRA|nr:hypothetical protein Pcac1_g20826 [Phytophthora cactorum]KAG2843553.1 hypothetical protein PC112_g2566 [Phytophthora cactorum]KAG2866789.1 hypothetical protein PC113_g2531 [Phytophthora cactorum]KAG2929508.1 hypothetical protein PC114_g2739 [Phytophthora cactorum]KAG2941153.1 hypothetical protein PC115_g2171 [Phytophthora cactorum]